MKKSYLKYCAKWSAYAGKIVDPRSKQAFKLEVLKYPETDTDEELLAETDEQVEKTEEDEV